MGTLDSVGEFTVSWSVARQKLSTLATRDSKRYLIHLLSAGIGLGAESVSVIDRQDRLEVRFAGLNLEEGDLAAYFDETDDSGGIGIEFLLGIHGAFDFGNQELSIESGALKGRAYRWRLTAEEHKRETWEASAARAGLIIKIRRQTLNSWNRAVSFLASLRGHVGMSEECRIVDRLCDRSRVEIKINGQLINRPFLFQTPLVATVGTAKVAGLGESEVVRLPPLIWSGVLNLVKQGTVQLVVRGVTCQEISTLGMAGTVWCDHLRLDLSREQIVRSKEYEALLDELSWVKKDLLLAALSRRFEKKVSPIWKTYAKQELSALFRSGSLSREEMDQCLKVLPGKSERLDIMIDALENLPSQDLKDWANAQVYRMTSQMMTGQPEASRGLDLVRRHFSAAARLERFSQANLYNEDFGTLMFDLQCYREQRECFSDSLPALQAVCEPILCADLNRSLAQSGGVDDGQLSLVYEWLWDLEGNGYWRSLTTSRELIETYRGDASLTELFGGHAYERVNYCLARAQERGKHLVEDLIFFMSETKPFKGLPSSESWVWLRSQLEFWGPHPHWADIRNHLLELLQPYFSEPVMLDEANYVRSILGAD
jgi:hypothetical protein